MFLCNTSKKSFFTNLLNLRYTTLLFAFKNSYYTSIHRLAHVVNICMTCLDWQQHPLCHIKTSNNTCYIIYTAMINNSFVYSLYIMLNISFCFLLFVFVNSTHFYSCFLFCLLLHHIETINHRLRKNLFTLVF